MNSDLIVLVISKDNKYFKIVHQPSIEIINEIANDNRYSLLMEIEKEQNNKKSCYNCIYNTLNSYDSELSINEAKRIQKDNARLKLLFDSEFCRCSKCGEYKRSGFGCYCENEE